MDMIEKIIDSVRNAQTTTPAEQELRKLVSAPQNKTIADRLREKNSGTGR